MLNFRSSFLPTLKLMGMPYCTAEGHTVLSLLRVMGISSTDSASFLLSKRAWYSTCMVTTTKHMRRAGSTSVIDPKARLDAWERARGVLSKSRMLKVLRQLRIVRKEWERSGR